MVTPEEGAARGGETPAARARAARGARQRRSSRRSPRGMEELVRRGWAASGAPGGASSGRRDGVFTTAVGYAGGYTANPNVRGGLAAVAPATRRPCWSSSTRLCDFAGRRPAAVLGGPRSDTGMRQGNDRGLASTRSAVYLANRGFSGLRQRVSRDMYQAELERARLRRGSRPRSPRAGPFYYAEPYHQQYPSRKNPNGYCGIGGHRLSACPVGPQDGVSATQLLAHRDGVLLVAERPVEAPGDLVAAEDVEGDAVSMPRRRASSSANTIAAGRSRARDTARRGECRTRTGRASMVSSRLRQPQVAGGLSVRLDHVDGVLGRGDTARKEALDVVRRLRGGARFPRQSRPARPCPPRTARASAVARRRTSSSAHRAPAARPRR